MRNPGKLVIVAIFAVALASVAFSTWYHYQGARHALDFWGSRAAVAIAQAPRIEALGLRPAKADDLPEATEADDGERQRLMVSGRWYRISTSKDASQAHGISNIRRALVLDMTFQWDAPEPGQPNWQSALEFRDQDRLTTVLFDFDSQSIAVAGSDKVARLVATANEDIREFFSEQFRAATPK